MTNWLCAAALWLGVGISAAAAEDGGVRRLVILCGHPGDEEYREQFVETVDRLFDGLTTHWGFAPEQARVLFGSEAMLADGSARPAHVTGPCTGETIGATLAEIRAALQPQDALWVIVLGHAYFDGRMTWFNLPGDDLHQNRFAELFADLKCRETAFWVTTAVSGYFLKPLSAEGRVLISATEADREINATVFPGVLAELLSSPPGDEELDVDQDGRTTLLDLYLLTAQRTAQQYIDENLIATEHAQFDDNGDGRVSEVQRGFLSPELGGVRKEGADVPKLESGRDGFAAAQIVLKVTRPAPVEADAPESTSEPAVQ